LLAVSPNSDWVRNVRGLRGLFLPCEQRGEPELKRQNCGTAVGLSSRRAFSSIRNIAGFSAL
jgi:hypothetical protein